MPGCALSYVTTGHPESAANIMHVRRFTRIAQRVELFPWWVWKYIKGCHIIRIKALGAVILFKDDETLPNNFVYLIQWSNELICVFSVDKYIKHFKMA